MIIVYYYYVLVIAGSRGMWLTYAIVVTLLHLFLLSIPFLSIPLAWTLTNVIHNSVRTFDHQLYLMAKIIIDLITGRISLSS